MKKIITLIFLIALAGCKSSDTWSDSAVYRTLDSDPVISYPIGMEPSGELCDSPLIDTKDGSMLILMRHSNGLGDYQVQQGKYGLRSGELLRIDCKTKDIIGIVSR